MSWRISTMLVEEEIGEARPIARLALRVPDGARVLIACEDRFITQQLKAALEDGGLFPESVTSMTAACDLARSGRYQVIVCAPVLSDGTWKRLIDLANYYNLGFEVILLDRSFDPSEWANTVEEGAFDVLDATDELAKAGEVIKHALWAAYLKGAGPRPRITSPPKAA
jgi:DNA-binding NtrC family response regulator